MPFIIILLSGHFFNSKKLKFVKFNVSIGSIVLFISLLGILRTGTIGGSIFDNLTLDFTAIGTISILIVGVIVGLILFLDTSIDVIVLALLKIGSPFINGFQKIFSSKPIDLSKIANEHDKMFFYDGSLTVPPCSEGVKWYVLKTPLKVSKNQMRAIIKAGIFAKTNARPVQKFNPEKY